MGYKNRYDLKRNKDDRIWKCKEHWVSKELTSDDPKNYIFDDWHSCTTSKDCIPDLKNKKKVCKQCGEEKKLHEFYRVKDGSLMRDTVCKTCRIYNKYHKKHDERRRKK